MLNVANGEVVDHEEARDHLTFAFARDVTATLPDDEAELPLIVQLVADRRAQDVAVGTVHAAGSRREDGRIVGRGYARLGNVVDVAELDGHELPGPLDRGGQRAWVQGAAAFTGLRGAQDSLESHRPSGQHLRHLARELRRRQRQIYDLFAYGDSGRRSPVRAVDGGELDVVPFGRSKIEEDTC